MRCSRCRQPVVEEDIKDAVSMACYEQLGLCQHCQDWDMAVGMPSELREVAVAAEKRETSAQAERADGAHLKQAEWNGLLESGRSLRHKRRRVTRLA